MKRITILCVLLISMVASASAQWRPLPHPDGLVGVSIQVDFNHFIVATRDSGIMRYWPDKIWRHSDSGLPMPLIPYRIGNEFLCTNKGVFIERNFGREWAKSGPSDSSTGSVYAFWRMNNSRYIGSDSGFFRSTDDGMSWERTYVSTSKSEAVNQMLIRFYDVIYIGTVHAGILRSNDSGRSWRHIDSGFTGLPKVLAFFDAGRLIVGTSEGLFSGTIHDGIWSPVRDLNGGTGVINDFEILWVEKGTNASRILAAANDGVLRTTNAGVSWKFMNEGLPRGTRVLDIQAHDDTVFICTDNNWIWYRPFVELRGPIVTIIPGDTVDICDGDSLTLSADIQMVNKIASVVWSNDAIDDNIVVKPRTDTAFMVTVQDTVGQISRDTVFIRVNPRPVADAGLNSAICPGSSMTIGTSAVPGNSYEWSPAVGVDNPFIAQPTVSPDTTTMFVLTVTNPVTPCVSRDTIFVTVLPSPSSHDYAEKAICSGGSTIIGVPGEVDHTYAWVPATGLDDSFIAQPTASPDSTTMYVRTATNFFFQCSSRDTVMVTVVGPSVGIAGPDRAICPGGTAILGSDSIPGFTYSWQPASGLRGLTAARPSATPASDAIFILTATGPPPQLCQFVDTVRVTIVPPLPSKYLTIDLCWGDTTTISTGMFGIPGGYSFQWDTVAGLSDPSVAVHRVSPDSTTLYTLTVSLDDLGAGRCITHDTIEVIVQGRPRAYVLQLSDDTLIALPAGMTYQWWKNGDSIAGGNNRKLHVAGPGNYSVIVTDSSGRLRSSAPHTFGGNGALVIRDLHIPYGVIDEDVREMMVLKNMGADTLVIDSVKFIPYDADPCLLDTSSFSITSAIVGLRLPSKDSARAFVRFAPGTLGIKAAKLLVYYSIVKSPVSLGQPPYTVQMWAQSIEPGAYLSVDAKIGAVAPVGAGGSTGVYLRIQNLKDPQHILPSTTPTYHVTLTVPASLLQFRQIGPSCGDVIPTLTQRVQWGTPELQIDYYGKYSPCDSVIPFLFTAMLGNIPSGTVRVQQFKWTGIKSDFVPVVRYDTANTFELQDICREGADGRPRLIIPDGIGIAKKSSVITLQPNPADQNLRIDFHLQAPCAADITICDVFGRVVRSIGADDARAGENSLTCDVANLPAGSYFTVLTALGSRTAARFDIAR